MLILKKFTVISLAVILAIGSMLTVGVSAAPAKLGFSVGSGEATPGEDVIVDVKMNTQNGSFNISAVNFQLNYDRNILEFKSSANVFFDVGYSNSKTGYVLYTAEDTYGKMTKTETLLCKLTFTVKSNATKGDTLLKLKIGECLDDALETISTSPTGNATVNAKISVTGGPEDDVIELINQIGTVEYTAESNLKITKARSAYAALTYAQKQLVTNYSVLLAAEKEYQRLKTEAENAELQAEINAFMTAHAYALSLTVDTCTIDDKAVVDAAIAAYESTDETTKLSPKAAYELHSYYNTLGLVKKKIALLIAEKEKEEEAIEADRKLREEAKSIAADFRNEYAELLATDPQNVPADYLSWLERALTYISDQSLLNLYVSSELQEEKALLEGLLEICKRNGAEENLTDAEIAFKKFNNTFSYILGLTDSTVTADDLTDIKIAVGVYEMMTDEVKEKLKDAYSLLEKLLTKAEELFKVDEAEKEAEESRSDNSGEKSSIEYIYVDSNGDGVKERLIIKKAAVNVSQEIVMNNRSIGMVSVIFLIAFAVITVNFVLLLCYYKFYFRRKRK